MLESNRRFFYYLWRDNLRPLFPVNKSPQSFVYLINSWRRYMKSSHHFHKLVFYWTSYPWPSKKFWDARFLFIYHKGNNKPSKISYFATRTILKKGNFDGHFIKIKILIAVINKLTEPWSPRRFRKLYTIFEKPKFLFNIL